MILSPQKSCPTSITNKLAFVQQRELEGPWFWENLLQRQCKGEKKKKDPREAIHHNSQYISTLGTVLLHQGWVTSQVWGNVPCGLVRFGSWRVIWDSRSLLSVINNCCNFSRQFSAPLRSWAGGEGGGGGWEVHRHLFVLDLALNMKGTMNWHCVHSSKQKL